MKGNKQKKKLIVVLSGISEINTLLKNIIVNKAVQTNICQFRKCCQSKQIVKHHF